MSLIAGPYFRGDPRVKPKQWGHASRVSAVIAERLENWYGIPWSAVDTVCPFWGPGSQQDYSRYGDILVPHPSNPAIFSAGPLGMGFKGDSTVTGTSYGFTTSKNPDFYFDQKSAFTLIMWVTPINAAGGACVYDDGGSTDGFSIAYKNTTKTFVFESTAGSDIETSGKLLLGESGSIGATFDGSTAKIFLNASVEGSGSHGAIAATTAEPGIMGRNVSSATSRDNQFGGFLYQLLRLNIKISDDLYGRIAEDRFALIQPPTFRTHFIPSEATQSPINSTLVSKFDIRNTSSSSLVSKFDIANTTSSTLISKFDIANAVASELVGKFDIRQLSSSTLVTKFDINNAVSAELIAKMDIKNVAFSENIAKFDIANAIGSTLTGVFDIREVAASELIAKFDLFSDITTVSSDLIAKFNIEQNVSSELINRFDIKNVINSEIVSKFNIRNLAASETVSKFDIANVVSAEVIAVYDMGGVAGSELICVFDIKDKSGRGGILTIGAKPSGIKTNRGVFRIG